MILTIEEPENHLAPHYLGRIIERLLRLSKSPRGQVLLSSHSPSIMSRIEPAQVRYLRLNAQNESEAHEILLPSSSDEAFRYVNDAVRAHPELYFSTLVVLGEGDSESIVLPRLAASLGVPLDMNFVSFVPLGGRHVSEMFKRERVHQRVSDRAGIFARVLGELFLVDGLEFDLIEVRLQTCL